MRLRDVKIAWRLSGTLGLLAALLVAVAAVAVFQMQRMHEASAVIVDKAMPSVEAVNLLRADLLSLRAAQLSHVLSTDSEAMKTLEVTMDKALAAFEAHQRSFVALVDDANEQRLYEAFAGDWKAYTELHQQVMLLSKDNQNELARDVLVGKGSELVARATANLDTLVTLNHDAAVAAATAAEAVQASSRNILLGVAMAALVLATILGLWLTRSITGPLNDALAAADRVADGDLGTPITADAADETGRLLRALQRMQDSLASTVTLVRGNAESVASASAQIAQGNTDLSQRTEEQASALQQTAATMDELGTTVRHNADNARQANQLAAQAAQVAAQGGQVVGQVVQTMQGINEGSKKIADIIAVIDGIAFQTNILALNAAVEAARAGEQGRGFAVVASEVRALAQRSAGAAKEIKTLITHSVDQVAQGSTQVGRAGQSMAEIVNAVRRLSDIVAEISAASTEQSSGVSEVAVSVSQLDQTTQQNAALVEQSAAAAESLRQQAAQLVQAVAVFRTAPAAMPMVAAPEVERRSPNRATNVVRPAFKSAAEGLPTEPKPAASAARTGTDDWESF